MNHIKFYREVSVEVFCKDPADIVDAAWKIYDDLGYSNLNIKVPIGFDELKSIKTLSDRNIPVNCTCCFTENQMKMAVDAGSRYASLFYCRLKDYGGTPDEILANIKYYIGDGDCQTIAGSIRTPEDARSAWDAGADIVTTGLGTIRKMSEHEKTTESVNNFLRDFEEWVK